MTVNLGSTFATTALIFLATATCVFGFPHTTASYVEEAQEMRQNANGTVYVISQFSPKVFAKTEEFELNSTSCVQYKYRLMEKKVKLRAYTCLIDEGGFCTMDKFVYPQQTTGCAYLRPWSWKSNVFSFYFVLERRPRKYGAHKKARRLHRRSGTVSSNPIGELRVDGIMPCNQVCDGIINRTPKEDRTNRLS